MKFRIIDDKSEVEPFFKEAFNPPIYDSEFTEADFDAEYWKIHSAVRSELGKLGKFSNLGAGDFAMNESRGASRWLSVDLTTDKMWNESLIKTITTTLANSGQTYMVYVSHDQPEYPLFHILVSNDEAMGWCEDREELPILQSFGFDVASYG
jgi:hypothetical protein